MFGLIWDELQFKKGYKARVIYTAFSYSPSPQQMQLYQKNIYLSGVEGATQRVRELVKTLTGGSQSNSEKL
ncbi:MAG: hypothetical protein R2827_10890 [Bdellovibrionales bacterium]